LPVGQTLTVVRNVPATQDADYVVGDAFPAESHEEALDKLTMLSQQLQEEVSRSAKLPASNTADADALVADIVLLANNKANIDTVAGSIGAVQAVADDIDDVSTVADDIANVNAVAGNATNINAVAGNSTNINAVAGNSTNINAVAGNATNINAVNANKANIDTVAGISGNVTSVAGNATNIDIVADNTANINAAVADIPSLAAKVSKTGDTMTGSLGIGGNVTGVIAGVSVDSKFCVKQEGTDPVAGFVKAENTTAGSGSVTFACRSRGTLAAPTVVQSGDALWNMYVAGHDGTDLALAAEIAVEVDGTPGSNDMPGRIVFKTTPDGQQAPVERMRIDSSGQQSSVIPGGSTLLPEFKCRAWVNFNGTGTVAIRASGNVSSITDNGTGIYTVNFTTAMPDANYAGVYNNPGRNRYTSFNAQTTTSLTVDAASSSASLIDMENIHVAVFR
jgi:hypothetical protein